MSETNQNHSAPRREPQPNGGREASRPKSRKRRRRPLILTIIIRLFQVLGTLLLVGVVTGSLMICFAAVYVKTVVMPQTYLDLSAYTMDENSVIYYYDKTTGQPVELQTLVGNENREIVRYEDIPEDLINAFIAIEDKRFMNHKGVDWRRTASGLSRLFTGGNIQGGSTITQQLIKNVTHRDDVTVSRKILEIFTALELENNYTKKEILTIYLNKIFLGNRCSGVQAASKYYFGKDVWDLSLAECASLAGITNNPSLYAPYGTVDVVRYQCQNPECKLYSLSKDAVCEYCGAENSYDNGSVWTNREFNKARQELILTEMAREDEARERPYITEAERDAAIAQPLVFQRDVRQSAEDDPEKEEKAKPATVYSWYVEAVISEAIETLMDKTRLDWETCEQMVFSGGLKIYVPYDPDVQAAVDEVYGNRANLDQVSRRTGQRLLSAITVVDNSTGSVVAMGSTEEKTANRGWNTPVATKRQPGSSIKPLSVYSPALEMGLITPASVVDDSPQLYDGQPWPVNVWPVYGGLTTILDGITESLNTIAVRVVDQVTPEKAYEYMTERYGITSLEAYRVTSTGKVQSDIDYSPMAMGGLTRGVSTFEMAAAFATFPRNGAFTTASTILEIKDAGNKTIVDNQPETNTDFVIKSETAYYINSMLTNAVNAGTGTAARIAGQTVAGKTGTTQDTCDYWFCGYTSYYTAAVWTGYSNREVINTNYYNPSVSLWQKVMTRLHEGLENQPFQTPRDLVSYDICVDCGKRSTADCANDVRGSRIKSFRLLSGDGPSDYCVCHVPVTICVDSPITDAAGKPIGAYHLAGEFCPAESVKEVTMVDYQREVVSPSVSVGDYYALMSIYDSFSEQDRYCHVHTTPQGSAPPVDDPEPSGGPGNSDPPPVVTEPYVVPSFPPVHEPTPPPTVDPGVEPPPGVDPVAGQPTEPPYIPVFDPESET